MEAKVVRVGTSLRLVIHRLIVATKRKSVRNGWATAFAKYALEGEDELMLP